MSVLSSETANKKGCFRVSLIHTGFEQICVVLGHCAILKFLAEIISLLFMYIYNTVPSSMALQRRAAKIEMGAVVLGRRGAFYDAAQVPEPPPSLSQAFGASYYISGVCWSILSS